MIWADLMGWTVPPFHVEVTEWLDHWTQRVKVLKMFRGGSKSTIVGTNVAHAVYEDPANTHILAQGADDRQIAKMSRHARHVVRRHPLCGGLFNREQWGVFQWSVLGNLSERDPSCVGAGVMSNVTASRASKVIFDDVEVPKNIKTPEARELLRLRTSESTHILVPGGRKLWIGTPHTSESIYDEEVEKGADLLEIPLFRHHKRYEPGEKDGTNGRRRVFPFKFKATRADLHVFHGRELLVDGRDYEVREGAVHFAKAPAGLVDLYAGNPWPARFDRADVQFRRRECKTTNEWDSQYGLKAKPVHQIRLDPDRLIGYEVDPEISYVNRECVMRLGKVRIVSATTWWDVALGKPKADDSAFVVILQDEEGRYYWHVAEALLGDLDAQCLRIREIMVGLQLELANVEVNAIGGFVPAVLRKHLAGTGVAVAEHVTTMNKDKKILEGLESPLDHGSLWAHARLWDGPLIRQMRDWQPGHPNIPNDFLDAGASAILTTPVRIGRIVGSVVTVERDRWRPVSGVHDIKFER